jgi:hypothetical protein
MRTIGFSTGAIAKSNYLIALNDLLVHNVLAVELSALRFSELGSLVEALPGLDLSSFDVVSFHAPSSFGPDEECFVVRLLQQVVQLGIPTVVHPDVIYSFECWTPFSRWLLVENMDKRKTLGRTADELSELFAKLPEARLCFDIGHARQVDPTMMEARRILEKHGGRLAEVHLSEVNSSSRHDPLSAYAVEAFQTVAGLIPEDIPIILETLIDRGQSDIPTELTRARLALEKRTAPVLTFNQQPGFFTGWRPSLNLSD